MGSREHSVGQPLSVAMINHPVPSPVLTGKAFERGPMLVLHRERLESEQKGELHR